MKCISYWRVSIGHFSHNTRLNAEWLLHTFTYTKRFIMSCYFPLSCSGRIAAALSISLVLINSVSADGIVPAEGSGVQVTTAPSGVPVVTIAPTNAAGLSHNRFNDYNVGASGTVLNNATVAGVSQLAGALPANEMLQGRAANVILNEVVTRNPSLLLGKQEVFGQAADYVLANPNGITCNGCGFINTPRVSLLVGSVQLAEGRLRTLQAGNEGASLTIGADGIGANDVLDLIAPRIDAQGKLVAVSGLNVILGNARVNYTSDLPRVGKTPVKVLDSFLLGGMQAGRISIISTDDGAGVNLGGVIQGQSLVKMVTRGNLDLEAVQINSDRILLSADQVTAHARSEHSAAETSNHDESWFIWQTGAEDTIHRSSKTSLERGHLDGKFVRINSRGEIGLRATDIVARTIRLRGRDISLAGELDQKTESADHVAWKNSWNRHQFTEQQVQRQVGSSLDAKHNLYLVSRRDISLQGAKIKAGHDVQLIAGQDLKLFGLVGKERTLDRGSRHLEGDALVSGSWHKEDGRELIRATEVTAGGVIAMSATNDLSMQGALLAAGGDISMRAGHDIKVNPQVLNQDLTQRDQAIHWGGLAGSERQNDSLGKLQNVASQVQSGGVLSLQAENDIHIVGSQLHGVRGARALAQHGRVGVEHATDLTQSLIDTRTGGAFDITTRRKLGDSQQQQVQGAQLASETNLELVSGTDMAVSGSQLQAKQHLNLRSGGDLKVHAAEQTLHEQMKQSDLKISGLAGADPNQSGTYRLGVVLTGHGHKLKRDQTVPIGSQLVGGQVRAVAGGALSLSGSSAVAQDGDLTLQGRDVSLIAAREREQREESDRVTAGGMYLSASLKQLRLGGMTSGSREKLKRDSRVSRGSQLSASGNLNVDAGAGTLSSEGSSLRAGGDVSMQAGEISQRAARAEVAEQRKNTRWEADIGANADPGVMLKPLAKVVAKLKSGKFSEAVADAGKIKNAVKLGIDKVRRGDWAGAKDLVKEIGMPTVGGSLTLAVQHQQSDTLQQQATSNQISGQQIRVQSRGGLSDQSSVIQAAKGLELTAQSLQFDSAQTQSHQSEMGFNLDLALQGSTSTGHDMSLKGTLGGSGNNRLQADSQALNGALSAHDGIEINIAQNAHFQGGRLDSGQGALNIHTGGDLSFSSAEQSHREQGGQLSATLALELNMKPKADQMKEFGGSGKLTWDGRLKQSAELTAVGTQLSGQRGIGLQAGQDLSLRGSQLGGATARGATGEIALSAKGRLDIQSSGQSSLNSSWDSTGDVGVDAQLKSLPGAHLEFKLNRDRVEQDAALPARIEARNVALSSGGDAHLSGTGLKTEVLSGQIAGDLLLESVPQRQDTRHTNIDIGLATPDLGKVMSGEGFTLRGKVQHKSSQLDAVTQPGTMSARQKNNLAVSGQTTVRGALLEAGGDVLPSAGKIILQSVPGRRDSRRWGGQLDGTPSAVAVQTVKDILAGKKPLGFEHEQLSEDLTQPGRNGRL
jgi:hemolysin